MGVRWRARKLVSSTEEPELKFELQDTYIVISKKDQVCFLYREHLNAISIEAM